jgi:hypothetical protein
MFGSLKVSTQPDGGEGLVKLLDPISRPFARSAFEGQQTNVAHKGECHEKER